MEKVPDNFIFKFVPNNVPLKTNIPKWKPLVPKPQRVEVTKYFHDPSLASHFGFYKTLNRLQEHYYWP